MGKHENRWRQRMPFARALSILLTVSMVLSLVPSQGIAEAQEELAAAMGVDGGVGLVTDDDGASNDSEQKASGDAGSRAGATNPEAIPNASTTTEVTAD